jgi:thiol-disulfide isomerase/thioredoxin
VEGHWSVLFRDEDGEEEARGEMRQAADGTVEGTFLTPTGDYRFLAGSYAEGRLRLSTFDGAHAFLFSATAGEDGGLSGDFWSRDSYHATWTAHPIAPEEDVLPDPWQLARFEGENDRLRFAFPNLEGEIVSHDDPRFAGKVVLVNLFGTWCPNCNDEAPHLAEWYTEYRDQGLEIVGLAYEFTGDPDRDRRMVARFGERYGIEYPLLLAGTSDKADAAATLPGLSAVIAYPTSIFIDRTGKVRRIYSGFSGPGTGEHYAALLAELEGTLEELLAEPAPEGA